MIVYCQNDLCENEALHIAYVKIGQLYLCRACTVAFLTGQKESKAAVVDIRPREWKTNKEMFK